MEADPFSAALWVAAIVIVGILFLRFRRQRRRHRIGAAAVGTVYNWLNEEKQHAVEIIVEERAAARDPEDRDGNLPELQNPKHL
jgi:hypothetical protein